MANEARGFLGSGDLFFGEFDTNGSLLGLLEAGNSTKLEVQPDSDSQDLISKGKNTYGQVLDSVVKPKPTAITIDVNRLDRAVFAMAFMGDYETVNEVAGTLPATPFVANSGRFFMVGKRRISSVVVTNEAGDTTYEVDVDYNIHPLLGMIRPIAGAAIADKSIVQVSCSYAGEVGYKITGAVQPLIEKMVVLDGYNLVDQEDGIFVAQKAILKPTSPVDFLSDDFTSVSLEGSLITPPGYSAPFTFEKVKESV